MSPRLIESLRVESGTIHLIALHEARMIRSLSALCPHVPLLQTLRAEGLMAMLSPYLPPTLPVELSKLRFVYSADTLESLSLQPYTPRQIGRLIPIQLPDEASYNHKWLDRSVLIRPDSLQANEEPIYIRKGLITDTSISNIALQMEQGGTWLTPTEPLLSGVMRQSLLDEGRIQTAILKAEDLHSAHAIALINAMLPLGKCTLTR